MDKPIIGIIAQRNVGKKDRVFQNTTKFCSAFSYIINLAGGIPIGVLFVNNEFNEDIMNACDGFVLQGGNTIESSQILAVKYALDSKKPLLGVCLGMQTMAAYEWLVQKGILTSDQIINGYNERILQSILEKKKHHNKLNPFYLSKISKAKHDVHLEDGYLKSIYDSDIISVPSVHNYVVKDNVMDNSQIFRVVGRSNDGVIEAIEAKEKDTFAIGVQFHPELETINMPLFEKTINKARLVRKR